MVRGPLQIESPEGKGARIRILWRGNPLAVVGVMCSSVNYLLASKRTGRRKFLRQGFLIERIAPLYTLRTIIAPSNRISGSFAGEQVGFRRGVLFLLEKRNI